MAPLKSFLLLPPLLASGQETLACANENCEAGDQTALLQSHLSRKSELSLSSTGAAFFPKLANLNDPHKRKEALLEMEKTAVKLANTQGPVEDVVVEICLSTANMLNETVLLSIIEEDAQDRIELQEGLDAFDEHEEARQAAQDAIDAAQRAVEQEASHLVECRTREAETCVEVERCHQWEEEEDCECANRCWVCEDHEATPPIICSQATIMAGTATLCCIDQKIHHRWCEGEGSDVEIRQEFEWRESTKTLFEKYNEVSDDCIACTRRCEVNRTICANHTERWTNVSEECRVISNDLRHASCEYHHSVGTALALYQQAYELTLEAYQVLTARIMIGEADRKVEWEVLTRVICLLLSLTVGQGDAGAVSAESNQARIQLCWDEEVDVSHLDIDYPDPPDMLDLPVLPYRPCDANFSVDWPSVLVPPECEALEDEHGHGGHSDCVCNAPVITQPELALGHFLMVDPAIQVSITNAETTWSTTFVDGTVHTGPLSAIHRENMPALTEAFFTEDEQTEEGANVNVAGVAWAYGSPDFAEDAASLEHRFASQGGLLFLNSDDEVVAVRGITPSATTLNQNVVAYLSFAVGRNLTDTQFAQACPTPQPVVDSVAKDRGARQYCWVKGAVQLAEPPTALCQEGCFAYELANGRKLVFPLIDGAFANSLSS